MYICQKILIRQAFINYSANDTNIDSTRIGINKHANNGLKSRLDMLKK